MSIAARFSLTYPASASPTFALDVDLQLPAQGITALFGPSGSGKTSLLRCIAGLEKVKTGHLIINGECWQKAGFFLPVHRRALGYVFQEASLFPHLTVQGNLDYGATRSQRHQVTPVDQRNIVELLGIGHLLLRKPERLSGGERQRVAIARALLAVPKLLLMDEPLAALDFERKREILPYLERLRDELAIPVLYVSHAPDEVARLADHLVVMKDGRAVASGPLAEMLTRLDLPIRLGEDAGAILDATVGAMDADWHLARVDFAGGSLWLADHGVAVGSPVRVRVLARDVSLAREQPGGSSIQNILPGRVDAIGHDEHPSATLVRVQVGQAMLLARLTRRSAAALGIAVGQTLWVQVKSVALLE